MVRDRHAPLQDRLRASPAFRLAEVSEPLPSRTGRQAGPGLAVPHTHLVAVWSDGALHFSTGVGEQKEINLRYNRRVNLVTGRNDWDKGFDIVVEGEAERVEDRDRLEQAAREWTSKWDGRWNYVVTEGGFEHPDDPDHNQVLVFAVRPERVLAFGKGGVSHTRHRFAS